MAKLADAGCSFAAAELPEALRWVARFDAGAPAGDGAGDGAEPADLDGQVRAAAERTGHEASFVSAQAAELRELFASRRPVVFVVRDDPGQRMGLVVPGRRRQVELVRPRDGSRVRVHERALGAGILERASEHFARDLDAVLERLPAGEQRARARAQMVTVILGTQPIVDAWILRPRQRHGFWPELTRGGIGIHAATIAVAYVLSSVCFMGAWALLGRATLLGRVDPGYLLGALLAFASSALLRALSGRASVDATLAFSTSLKRWLLGGALALDLEHARRQGSAQLLALVLESGELESLALDGVLLGSLAVLEGILAVLVLFWSPIGGLAAVWFSLVLLGALGLSLRLLSLQRRWTEAKTSLTAELVESLLGHRTRTAQCPATAWHEREEVRLESYRRASSQIDEAGFLLRLLGRAGMFGGFASLAPAIAAGAGASDLAAAIGAVLLAHGALERFTDSVIRLGSARVSFERVRPLFEAGYRQPLAGALGRGSIGDASRPLLEARELVFRYPTAKAQVISGLSLSVRTGERLLIEAPSGGGKSTLLSLLSGLWAPESGRLYSRGFERVTLGDAEWRGRVVSIPQFNQNHVFSGTLAFNCLLGSAWPATPDDVARAERVLTELGLGPLLAAMPGGMEQAVGETGWRLSHGEQARLFLARGLLREPDVLLIDESFGALDPETTLTCLRHVERAAGAVVLVAHR